VKRFELLQPSDLREATAMLAAYENKEIMVLAGGTDIVPARRAGAIAPNYLLDITGLNLNRIARIGNHLQIGAACTFKQIVDDPFCIMDYPDLCAAARSIGAVQTRNLATIGGNVCSAVPSLDSAPPLLVHDGLFILQSVDGARRVPAKDFFVGPRRTAKKSNEILTEIILPYPSHGFRAGFIKFGRRNALTLSLVNAGVGFAIVNAAISGARVSIGACAPTPVRIPGAEAYLDGKRPEEINDAQLKLLIGEAIRPISDARASADYRKELAFALVKKIIRSVAAEVIE